MLQIRLRNGRVIGDGAPSFIVAEAGINHNGDMDRAHAMIDAVAATGADAVKFQNYRTEDFVSDRSLRYEYESGGKTIVESQFDMFKRCELSADALEKLRVHSDRRGLACFATPTGQEGIDQLVRAGAPLLKNGSDYLVNLHLIEAMAKTGLPTVLSTGMATLSEIEDAVTAFTRAGGRELILLHCTSNYPTAPEDVHLRKMTSLKSTFGCVVGLSDHSEGWLVAAAAVAMGACFIEKHFTLDKNLPGPDHRFSNDPAELRTLVEAIRSVERTLGSASIGPTATEEDSRREFRLSCVAATDLEGGIVLQPSHIAFRRPGSGHPPKDIDQFIGRRLIRRLTRGDLLDLTMCE